MFFKLSHRHSYNSGVPYTNQACYVRPENKHVALHAQTQVNSTPTPSQAQQTEREQDTTQLMTKGTKKGRSSCVRSPLDSLDPSATARKYEFSPRQKIDSVLKSWAIHGPHISESDDPMPPAASVRQVAVNCASDQARTTGRAPGPMSASSANAISSTSASSAKSALGQSLSGKLKSRLVLAGCDEALQQEEIRGARTSNSRSSKLR